MLTKTYAATLIISISVLLVPTGGFCNEAKEKFLEGVALIEEGNYPAALLSFETSYQIKPNATVLFNIAMSQKALYKYVDSIGSFKRYLADPKAKKGKKKQAEQAISEMEEMLGRLSIEGAQDDAEIRVDGRIYGRFPLAEPIWIDPGKHVVEVSHQGFEPMRADVTILSGAVLSVSATLSKVGALIDVDCSNIDALVYIDEQEVGRCPSRAKVTPGEHQVRINAPGMKDFIEKVDAKVGLPIEVKATLEKLKVESTSAPSVEAAPVEEDTVKSEEERDDGVSGLFIAGLITAGVGLAGAGVGIYYSTQWNAHSEEVAGLATKVGEATSLEERLEYEEQYNNKKAKIEDDEHPKDKIGMIVGYAAGGALIVTGVVLMAIGMKDDKESGHEKVSFKPTIGGMAVTF
jgi:PEGA domain-containing protein